MSKTFQAATIGAAILGSTLALSSPAEAATQAPSANVAYSPSAQDMLSTSTHSVADHKVNKDVKPQVHYTVESGDTLSGIGEKYCVSWHTIYADNKKVIGPNPDLIFQGQKYDFDKVKCSVPNVSVSVLSNKSNGNNYQTQHKSTVNAVDYTVTGTPQHIAWNLLPSANRAGEYWCLNNIIMSESSWDVHAYNPSGAYGIPQALPGNKMAGPWGTDWENDPYVQLYWMIRYYIPQTYGTACDAWAFHLAHGWY